MIIIAGINYSSGLLAKAGVTALVTQPDNSTAGLTLHDDGISPDQSAGDGLYSRQFLYTQSGTHNVSVTFNNDQFSARVAYSAYEFTPPPSGLYYHEIAHAPIPVVENFNVTGSTRIVTASVPTNVRLSVITAHFSSIILPIVVTLLSLIGTIIVLNRRKA